MAHETPQALGRGLVRELEIVDEQRDRSPARDGQDVLDFLLDHVGGGLLAAAAPNRFDGAVDRFEQVAPTRDRAEPVARQRAERAHRAATPAHACVHRVARERTRGVRDRIVRIVRAQDDMRYADAAARQQGRIRDLREQAASAAPLLPLEQQKSRAPGDRARQTLREQLALPLAPRQRAASGRRRHGARASHEPPPVRRCAAGIHHSFAFANGPFRSTTTPCSRGPIASRRGE